jgi:hypothetical protein
MLFQIKNDRFRAGYPQLSRVWIKTGNPKLPLKSVWFDETKMPRTESRDCCSGHRDSATHELAEDHLVPAA